MDNDDINAPSQCTLVPPDKTCKFNTFEKEVKEVRENCISPKKNGSFAFCTKLLKESYDIALLCRGSCPSSLTPTTPAPTNAPSVCGPPSGNYRVGHFG